MKIFEVKKPLLNQKMKNDICREKKKNPQISQNLRYALIHNKFETNKLAKGKCI